VLAVTSRRSSTHWFDSQPLVQVCATVQPLPLHVSTLPALQRCDPATHAPAHAPPLHVSLQVAS
jgi:hypothetical protein